MPRIKGSLHCKITDCFTSPRAQGYCSKHYVQARKAGVISKLPLIYGELIKIDSTKDLKQRGFLAPKTVHWIKHDAIKNGAIWQLSPIETYYLIVGNCYYCGKKSNWPKARNGIDRLESNGIYVSSNCVTACKRCNYAKSNRNLQEFMAWIKTIYKLHF